jgi:nicotinate phosphoribosyltransferase
MKQATDKVTFPGRKQIFRRVEQGQVVADRLGLMEEHPNDSEQPLLQQVMHQGRRCQPPETIDAIAQRTRQSVICLPASLRQLSTTESMPVQQSSALQALIDHTRKP